MEIKTIGNASNGLNQMYNVVFLGSFMASVKVHCPRSQSAQVYRHDQNPKGHGRFHCRDCHRAFQLTYACL
ncbi:IS1 family transposase [Edwardsiella ictaluri]|uniref:IS1 family transposase n=1 Tax=Edwardsiella ictaluri TaxID=67780 RepID=UPI0039C72807